MTSPKAPSDPIAWFSREEPEMRKAIELAQAHFPQFEAELLREAKRAVPAMDECLIKYAFPATQSGVEVEHMFLSDIYHDGTLIHGTLASEPQYAEDVSEGDEIVVERERVSDWLYVIEGEARGGYTFRRMWESFSKAERKQYRKEPPFVWLKLS